MRSYAQLAEHQIFNLTGARCCPMSSTNFMYSRVRKIGIIFCSGQLKTIFNLMICWELRLKPSLEYRTVRSFEDKLSSLFHSARLAQLIEHQTFNLRAMDSSPISGSNHIYHCFQTCALNDSNILKGLFWKKQNIWKKVGKLIFSSYIWLSIRVMWHLNLCRIFVSRRSFVATWQDRNFESSLVSSIGRTSDF